MIRHSFVLADIHAVIAYYPRYRDKAQAYRMRREEEAVALQAKIGADLKLFNSQEAGFT
jgi:hypothetical protein